MASARRARADSREPSVELLWFNDCPNHPAARAMLGQLLAELAPGTEIKDIDATDPAVAQRHRFPGSPTIRVDGRDVDPSIQDPGDYTPRCRLYWTVEGLQGVPERAWIESALRASPPSRRRAVK
ncbi:MAG: hypothetical protein FIA92_14760 [Chloroflexi bacterium]|nr:hypothetical protein [Chloroflexota bacterium]